MAHFGQILRHACGPMSASVGGGEPGRCWSEAGPASSRVAQLAVHLWRRSEPERRATKYLGAGRRRGPAPHGRSACLHKGRGVGIATVHGFAAIYGTNAAHRSPLFCFVYSLARLTGRLRLVARCASEVACRVATACRRAKHVYGPHLADITRIRPTQVQLWPTSATELDEFGQHVGRDLAQIWSEFGPLWSKFVRTRPKVGQHRSTSGRTRLKVGQCRSMFGRTRPDFVRARVKLLPSVGHARPRANPAQVHFQGTLGGCLLYRAPQGVLGRGPQGSDLEEARIWAREPMLGGCRAGLVRPASPPHTGSLANLPARRTNVHELRADSSIALPYEGARSRPPLAPKGCSRPVFGRHRPNVA